ncbi:MAG TPA: HD-GYP domain-containing protein [Longimicrobiales bacterium]|nr:HD-GYP domain-containing protein [Longimicrobiales bacterium]
MSILSESLAIRLTVGKSAGNSSITFIPLLASVQLFGPEAAVLLMGVTGILVEFAIRRNELIRGVFNSSQLIFATFIAGWAFGVVGGTAVDTAGTLGRGLLLIQQLAAFVSFGLVFLALNHAAVSLAITLSQGLRFSEVWAQMLGHSGATLNDVLISPIAIAVAFLYVQAGVMGILVVLLPLLFVRHSYWTTSRLREANADLLKALVKAIETRDPYTSGHSLRVSFLAKRIAEALDLPRATAERIGQAALLHDIGKIESLYSEILAKPASLTPEERVVIRSHVTKGEELLRNLASVPDDILLTVKHHHEREDGAGYPDGLRGDQIPIGARIVAVCDAVDAMLSDRPYRSALSVPDVLQQLREHTGSQFAPRVVRALLESGIISEYADIMRVSRSQESRPDLDELRPSPRPGASHWQRHGLSRLSQGAF